MFHATLEIKAIWNFLRPFNFRPSNTKMLYDNQAAQMHAKTATSAKATASRHREIYYRIIRKAIRNQKSTVHHVSTTSNLADLFTKPRPCQIHDQHCRSLNLGRR